VLLWHARLRVTKVERRLVDEQLEPAGRARHFWRFKLDGVQLHSAVKCDRHQELLISIALQPAISLWFAFNVERDCISAD